MFLNRAECVTHYIDIHVHILPGMDDGPSTLQESLEMARIAVRDGIRIMVATPHCLNGLYVNWRSDILSACAEFNSVLKKRHILLTVLPGSEIYLSPEIIEALENGLLMTLNDTGQYFLLELPHQFIPEPLIGLINRLNRRKIIPVIVHPERNITIQRNVALLYDFISAGALVQITAGSLTGNFGRSAFKCCQRILELKMAHFMASDAHSSGARSPKLSEAFIKLSSMVGKVCAERIMFEDTEAVLEGRKFSAHFS
ncbi:MAG: tyrosine protein phosphatase [Deltaproteobacteria bacterium]|nr:tyrosine protein phosphatase [Deltaproteobacteria bacterium]MBW2660412.1 tyrosine protein phosphatase [Deltaproteobacteria bacterium]